MKLLAYERRTNLAQRKSSWVFDGKVPAIPTVNSPLISDGQQPLSQKEIIVLVNSAYGVSAPDLSETQRKNILKRAISKIKQSNKDKPQIHNCKSNEQLYLELGIYNKTKRSKKLQAMFAEDFQDLLDIDFLKTALLNYNIKNLGPGKRNRRERNQGIQPRKCLAEIYKELYKSKDDVSREALKSRINSGKHLSLLTRSLDRKRFEDILRLFDHAFNDTGLPPQDNNYMRLSAQNIMDVILRLNTLKTKMNYPVKRQLLDIIELQTAQDLMSAPSHNFVLFEPLRRRDPENCKAIANAITDLSHPLVLAANNKAILNEKQAAVYRIVNVDGKEKEKAAQELDLSLSNLRKILQKANRLITDNIANTYGNPSFADTIST